MAYAVLAGNTRDKTTLAAFLAKIKAQYGAAERLWILDRGIPSEDRLALMRDSAAPVNYRVGTPKRRLSQREQASLAQPWAEGRENVEVKLLSRDEEVSILARRLGRQDQEPARRRRRLKRLCQRLTERQRQQPRRDDLRLKLGAARKEAGRAYDLLTLRLPEANEVVTPQTFTINRRKLRQARRREGRYLLRSKLRDTDPAKLWPYYLQLTEIEQAFKELKHDLALRPMFHQREDRIEAPILVAFLAYCLQVTLKQRLRALEPGLTPRAAVEKFAALQMIDVHLPTTDGRTLILSRYTEPERDQQLLLQQLPLQRPEQPPPRITADLMMGQAP